MAIVRQMGRSVQNMEIDLTPEQKCIADGRSWEGEKGRIVRLEPAIIVQFESGRKVALELRSLVFAARSKDGLRFEATQLQRKVVNEGSEVILLHKHPDRLWTIVSAIGKRELTVSKPKPGAVKPKVKARKQTPKEAKPERAKVAKGGFTKSGHPRKH